MPQPQQPNPWRYAHMGLELAGAILVLALVGYWVDYRFGTGPWGVLAGVLIGGVGGMYLFIKDALAANRQFSYDRFTRKPESESSPDEPEPPEHADSAPDADADTEPDSPDRRPPPPPDPPPDQPPDPPDEP